MSDIEGAALRSQLQKNLATQVTMPTFPQVLNERGFAACFSGRSNGNKADR